MFGEAATEHNDFKGCSPDPFSPKSTTRWKGSGYARLSHTVDMHTYIHTESTNRLSYLLLEPFHCLVFRHSVWKSNSSPLPFAISHVISRPSQNNVEIHAVDSNARIILYSQIDMFLDSKPEISSVRKCIFP